MAVDLEEVSPEKNLATSEQKEYRSRLGDLIEDAADLLGVEDARGPLSIPIAMQTPEVAPQVELHRPAYGDSIVQPLLDRLRSELICWKIGNLHTGHRF